MWFHPVAKELLFTKHDKEDPRLGEFIQILPTFSDLKDFPLDGKADFHLVGYPDDEGIGMNGGRTGAQTGPRQIRSFLYKMTPDLTAHRLPRIADIGDGPINVPLPERHERARAVIRELMQKNRRVLSFGGGHDYGYCDVGGFLDVHADQGVVINFDAHLDVRPDDKGFHSGTPFYRILKEFGTRVKFFEVGLQPQCNSQAHFAWAQQQGAELITMEDLRAGFLVTLQQALRGLEGRPLFVSLDMDAFSSMEAPGCSQSWATGFSSREFLPAFEWLIEHFVVHGLGIYETAPSLDFDNHTSKLAALIAHRFIFRSLAKAGT